MATVTALASDGGYDGYDAYGVTTTPPYGGGTNLNIPGTTPYDGVHLFIALKVRTPWTISEVTFDDSTDVLGTNEVPGHPGVIGLWLSAFTTGATVGHSATSSSPAYWVGGAFSSYVVPDLRPADNGYMAVRGRVWPPGERAHAYP